MSRRLSVALPMSVAVPEGSATNRNILMTTASTMATAMTTLSMLAPSLSASHFSNLLGSSSITPSICVLLSSVSMPILSITTMFTQPRISGSPIHLCFLESGSRWLHVTMILPLGLRTAMAMDSSDGLCIITPSMTACPPMSLYCTFSLLISIFSFSQPRPTEEMSRRMKFSRPVHRSAVSGGA